MASGYRMPAEWEPHAATWLAWPHYKLDWPDKFEPIPWVYAEIIRYLSLRERVEIIVEDASAERLARKTLKRAHALRESVRFHRWPTDRVWTRDSGCAFVWPRGVETRLREKSKATGASAAGPAPAQAGDGGGKEGSCRAARLGAVTWRFNAWAKYPNSKRDQKIGGLMATAAGAKEIQPQFKDKRVVLEGGSIDVNGSGTLLTTEECLLSRVQQRNPGMKKPDYERIFARYLGADNVIWLGSGIVGDDTHGHVDDITRFVSPDTVVTSVDADPKSDNYEPLRENIRRLRDATNEQAKPLAIIDLPMPAPLYFEGRRLPASYANFYIANGVVLVPVFNDPNDRIALDILADIFPERDVVGIYCGDLIWGFGAIHCMTQQQPEAKPPAAGGAPERSS
ncbi:MAG: agmatine deiminase family protein [Acidobacteria bacterium]|nr:agmatine deiminase family protein [Acidobacteriota bacterium]